MAEIVFAAGVPHAPAYVGLFDKAPPEDREVLARSYAAVKEQLAASKPDVVIVFANDHLTNSRIRAYPDFLIGGAGEHSGPHEWFQPWIGCRNYTIAGNPDVAKALFRGMTRRDVRMHLSDRPLNFDDNLSVPVTKTDMDQMGVTLVPVLQNCTVPPYPDGWRCYEVGLKLAEVIRDELPKDMRVALIGSGGLSHEPGGARYFKIDEDFDRHFIDLCVKGRHRPILEEVTPQRMEEAGRGGTAELLSWFPVMAAIGECPGTTYGYSGWPSFRCGFGLVIWDVKAAKGRKAKTIRRPRGQASANDAWKGLDPALASHDLVQDLKWDRELRRLFETDEAKVLDRYDLLPAERKAIEERDFRMLYDLGMHPYLGGQLSRFIWGNDAAKGAVEASNRLVASLQGHSEGIPQVP